MEDNKKKCERAGKIDRKRFKLGVVYSSEEDEEMKEVDCGKVKEQQREMNEERKKEEEAAKLKEKMEDKRKKEERSAKLKNMKQGWDVEDQMFQMDRAGRKEGEKRRLQELKTLKERCEDLKS